MKPTGSSGKLGGLFFFLVFSEENISFVANIRLTNENETVSLDKVFLLQFLVSMPNSPTFRFSNLLLYNAVYLYLCVWCVCLRVCVCVCVWGWLFNSVWIFQVLSMI